VGDANLARKLSGIDLNIEPGALDPPSASSRGSDDLSIQLEAHSSAEKDSGALDICTPAQKEIAQFGRVVITTE